MMEELVEEAREEENNVLKDFFLLLENSKELEIGEYPGVENLLNRIKDDGMWENFEKLSFNHEDMPDFFLSQPAEIRRDIFMFGISCFVYFIQCNFTGPALPDDIKKIIDHKIANNKSINFARMLTVNNEEININVKYPILMVVAKYVFEKCLVASLVNSLWSCRAITIHQSILDERSPPLLAAAEALFKQIDTYSLRGYERAKFELEISALFLNFRSCTKANDHIRNAEELLGIAYDLKAVKAPNDANVVKIDIFLTSEDIDRPTVHKFIVPRNLEKYSNNQDHITLPNNEQKLFLIRVNEIIVGTPPEDLIFEEVIPFIEQILKQDYNTWSVRVSTLLRRVKLEIKFYEKHPNAKSFKCVNQIKEIVESLNRPKPHVLNRIGDAFSCNLKPKWKLDEILGDYYFKVNAPKQALALYKKISNWKKINRCYFKLNSPQEAAKIFQQKLRENESVKMLCYLGDATDDVQHYQKAWELSRKRSHRVQRHWGLFLFKNKKYKECIPLFEKTASINPLQPKMWLNLGNAAKEIEHYPTAATAFRRYTNMKPYGYKSWSLLGEAYLKTGNKRSAHEVLVEALKYNTEEYEIWENLLHASIDVLHYRSLIRSYDKLLDFNPDYINYPAMTTLVYNLCSDVSSNPNPNNLLFRRQPIDPDGTLMKGARQLLGKILTCHPHDGYAWELYAWLVPPSILRLYRLQRAYKAYTITGWERQKDTCSHVLNVCKKIGDLTLMNSMELHNTTFQTVINTLGVAIAATTNVEGDDVQNLLEQVVSLSRVITERFKTPDKFGCRVDEIVIVK